MLKSSVPGRFGGIVMSQTQSILDVAGVSKVSADYRDMGGVPINQTLVSLIRS